jgi:Type-IV b secretion system, inner-membrane complex component
MYKNFILFICLFISMTASFSLEPTVPLQVWVNEAIINTFSFSDTNLINRQKDIALYFTPDAWKVYLDTLNRSNILKQVQENHYQVSAVALMPPTIAEDPSGKTWQAQMPILVKYKNNTSELKQHLDIRLKIIKSPSSDSRGFAILQYESKIIDKPCSCAQAYYPKVTIV